MLNPPARPRPTIVLLHSLGTDSALWRHQVRALESLGPMLTPECRGHGSSAWPGNTSIVDWVDDLHKLLAPIEELHLVGLSMGGIQAIAYASRHPEQVRSLVVANSFARLSAAQAAQRFDSARHEISAHGIQSHADAYLRQTLTRSLLPNDYAALRRAISSMQPEAYLASAAATFQADITPLLPQIACPTLVLTGDRDMKTPVANAQEIASAIRGARVELIDDAGHLSCIENPLGFNRTVAGFIHAIDPAAAGLAQGGKR